MKRTVLRLCVLVMIALMAVHSAHAQQEVTVLEQVEVDIWPDFDRPATLVLLNLTLPADAGEQTLSLPLPDDADVNAVARIDASGDLVTDQITVDDSTAGQLAITTASPQIRVEYYVPYEADGEQRQISFNWSADVIVEELVISIQQPAAATDFEITSAGAEVASGQFGLPYHTLDPVSLTPGESFSVEAAYRLVEEQLTAAILAEQQPPASESAIDASSTETAEDNLNLALVAAVAGAILVAAAVAYLLLSRRPSRRRVVKPRPRRAGRARTNKARPGPARFCHNCGESTSPSDKFCRNCGAELRRS